VEEAATDVIRLSQACGIREPWTDPSFIDAVVALQTRRELRVRSLPEEIQFHDRSVVCTAALATYLQFSFSRSLELALERITREGTFERRVFFIRNLGFVAPTEARRISYEESLRFEEIHEKVYRSFGFALIAIEAGSLEERADKIKRLVEVAAPV
jgi:predicted ATPase